MIFRQRKTSKKPKNKTKITAAGHKRCVLFILLSIAVLFVSSALYIYFLLDTNTIYHGIYIDGIHVGGLTRREALDLLNESYAESGFPDGIMLITPFNKYRLPFADIGYAPLYGKAVDEAYLTARHGNIFERLIFIRKLRKHDLQIYAEMCYNKEKLAEIIKSISIEAERAPKNADVKVSGGNVKITQGQSGYLLDIDLSMKRVERNLKNRTATDIDLFGEEILPDITTEMVDKITFELGTFTTSFNAQNDGRAHNIKAACGKINQRLLLPGESFSMDKALGDRTEANGYKQARVIINNELVDGLGGGICQVTSTLYNTVLLSGLEVLERRNHTLPLTYIEMGRDATIAQGYIDFKFTNNCGYAVIIEAKVIGNQVRISIWGCKPNENIKRRIRTKIIEKIMAEGVLTEVDETLKPGETVVVREAIPGYKVEVFVDTMDINGKVIKTERISVDYYIPQKKKIKVSPQTKPSSADLLSVLSYDM